MGGGGAKEGEFIKKMRFPVQGRTSCMEGNPVLDLYEWVRGTLYCNRWRKKKWSWGGVVCVAIKKNVKLSDSGSWSY